MDELKDFKSIVSILNEKYINEKEKSNMSNNYDQADIIAMNIAKICYYGFCTGIKAEILKMIR